MALEYAMEFKLNIRASCSLARILERELELRVTVEDVRGGGRLFDLGVDVPGGLSAGRELALACLADMADVSVTTLPLFDGVWPAIQVATDHPVAACLFSQYAGWEIKTEKFFALGSGPMRAVAGRESLFQKLDYREEADRVIGVLETSEIPPAAVYRLIAEECNVSPGDVDLLCASVCSPAGNVQVVARSVETAMHKLLELGFDVQRVQSGHGVAPLPPVGKNTLDGIGRTNDAILYGATVTLWVTGDDDSLRDVGPKVPSESSAVYGQPFRKIFEDAGRDFYKIDPHLFSPAVIVLHNLETGSVFRFGRTNEDVLRESFGIA
jgi:methenyltetrahydromethanopterin cyclohydrolase